MGKFGGLRTGGGGGNRTDGPDAPPPRGGNDGPDKLDTPNGPKGPKSDKDLKGDGIDVPNGKGPKSGFDIPESGPGRDLLDGKFDLDSISPENLRKSLDDLLKNAGKQFLDKAFDYLFKTSPEEAEAIFNILRTGGLGALSFDQMKTLGRGLINFAGLLI
ncbi:MAG TPA: hypothetical protein VIM12_03815 [Noviherbaspirillum sp.]|jgi:hypothetical protein|uniref:hypothetical protein n=1 Tax=Noviherbaspirillum sp. TaxID=1926288 RepID=UPI002F93E071